MGRPKAFCSTQVSVTTTGSDDLGFPGSCHGGRLQRSKAVTTDVQRACG